MSLGTLKWRYVWKNSEEENGCGCDFTLLLYADTDDVLDTWKQFATRTNILSFIFGILSVYPMCTGTSFTTKSELTCHVQLLLTSKNETECLPPFPHEFTRRMHNHVVLTHKTK
jgi:hypothetical protein